MGIIQHYELRDYPLAIRSFQRALALGGLKRSGKGPHKRYSKKDSHDLGRILAALGDAYEANNQWSLALDAFEAAGEAYCRYDNFDNRADPAVAIQLLKKVGYIHYWLGNVVEMMEVWNDAKMWFDRLELTPESVALFGEKYPFGILTVVVAPAA